MENEKTNDGLKLVQEYWDEAKTRLWRQYHVDQFGRKQGEYKFWHKNGQIGRIGNFKDGTMHGKFQSWCNDGTRWHIDTHHLKKGIHGTDIKFKYGK